VAGRPGGWPEPQGVGQGVIRLHRTVPNRGVAAWAGALVAPAEGQAGAARFRHIAEIGGWGDSREVLQG
jgi:hypothetical protein